MTNREIFNDLDNLKFLLAIREFARASSYKQIFELKEWLNERCDKYFWFDELEILHLDEEKYCG